MELIAKKQLEMADDVAKRMGKRVRAIKAGEPFEVESGEGQRLIDRGFAVDAKAKADEEALEQEELEKALGKQGAQEEAAARAKGGNK